MRGLDGANWTFLGGIGSQTYSSESNAWHSVPSQVDSRCSSRCFRLRKYREGRQRRTPVVFGRCSPRSWLHASIVTIAQGQSLDFWFSAIGRWTSFLILSPFSAFLFVRGGGAMDIRYHPIFHFSSAAHRKSDSACTTPSARLKPRSWSLECSF